MAERDALPFLRRLMLPCALYPVARECLACGTRHIDTPGGGSCRQCGKPMPESGGNSRIVRWRDGEQVYDA